MDPQLLDLLQTLRCCAHAEEAAYTLLDRLSVALTRSLEGRAEWDQARVEHSAVHLHDGQGFQGTFQRDHSQATAHSQNAWGALLERGQALVLDVSCLELRFVDGSLSRLSGDQQLTGTVTRLKAQSVTHLLALPMRGPQSRLRGMITLELNARRGVGLPLPLTPQGWEALQAQADLGLLLLLLLPAAPAPPAQGLSSSGVQRALLRQAQNFAQTDLPLLLRGARGSGRRWLADWIHQKSDRKELPLHSCSSKDLSALELRAALDQRGSLLLLDVEQLSAHSLSTLLRWLEEGAQGVRLICTCDPLNRLQGELSRALRGALTLPSLNQRHEDIPAFVLLFLGEHLQLGPEEVRGLITAESMRLLQTKEWPGNLHELRATVQLAWGEAERRRRRAGLAGPHPQLLPEDLRAAFSQASAQGLRVTELLRPALRALARRCQDHPLPLARLEGVSGLVLAELLEQGVTAQDAARSLALAHQVGDGNYLKTLRNAADKATRLCELLGEPAPAALNTLKTRHRRSS